MDISDVFRLGRMARHGAEASAISNGDPYVIGFVVVLFVFSVALRFWRNRR